MKTAAKDDAGIKDDLLLRTCDRRMLFPDRPYRQSFRAKRTDGDAGLPVVIVKVSLVNDLGAGLLTEVVNQLLLGSMKKEDGMLVLYPYTDEIGMIDGRKEKPVKIIDMQAIITGMGRREHGVYSAESLSLKQ
jgi:hypothetical protein